MQVSNRYYTPYQTNTSVKYCAGFSQTEEGKLTPNETAENPGFAEIDAGAGARHYQLLENGVKNTYPAKTVEEGWRKI